MVNLFRHSIKAIFFYSFLFLIIVPGFLIGLLSMRSIESNLEQEIIVTNLVLARSLATQVDEILSQAEKIMLVTGGMAQEELAAGRNLDSALVTIVEAFPAFSRLQILDNQGIVRHTSRQEDSWIGYDLSRHPTYVNALNQTDQTDFYWSRSHIPIKGKTPSIAVSSRANGFVVIGYLDLAELSRKVRTLASEYGVRAAILDRRVRLNSASIFPTCRLCNRVFKALSHQGAGMMSMGSKPLQRC